jgi:hypothetical protein
MVVAVCAQLDGEQHEALHVTGRFVVGECPKCGYPVLWCEWCEEPASCCLCGRFHSVDCPRT